MVQERRIDLARVSQSFAFVRTSGLGSRRCRRATGPAVGKESGLSDEVVEIEAPTAPEPHGPLRAVAQHARKLPG
jgi:hypothetical protein